MVKHSKIVTLVGVLFILGLGLYPSISRTEAVGWNNNAQIELISPAGAEVIRAGSDYLIEWRSKKLSRNDIVEIRLRPINQNPELLGNLIATVPSQPGRYLWHTPIDLVPGKYSLDIFSWRYPLPVVWDKIDWPIVVIGQNTAAALELIYPNGGEYFEIGRTYTIRWASYGLDDVSLHLIDYRAGPYEVPITPGSIPASLGQYTWTVPQDISPNNPDAWASGSFKIEIRGKAISDDSDNFFKIVPFSEGLG